MSYSKRSGSGQTKNAVCVLLESAPCPLQGQLCEVRVSQGSRSQRGEPALDYATRWGGCQEPEPSGPSSPGCPAPAPALGGILAGALPGLAFLPPSPEARLLSSRVLMGVAKP